MRRTLPVRGYTALITTLIICTVLTTLCLQAGTSAYLARLSALEYGYSQAARSNAYSCAQIALFEMSADWNYVPRVDGDLVSLSEKATCVIESVSREGSTATLIVHGSHKGFTNRLQIILEERAVTKPPFSIRSFRQI